MEAPIESPENNNPQQLWQQKTEHILNNLREHTDILLGKNSEAPPSVPPISNNKISLETIEIQPNVEPNLAHTLPDEKVLPPSFSQRIRRPLLYTMCIILPFLLLTAMYNNTIPNCKGLSILYKDNMLCANTNDEKDAIYEYIACDYIKNDSMDTIIKKTVEIIENLKRDEIIPTLEQQIIGDKYSFRKNVGIAYFNRATRFLNEKQVDSACWAFGLANDYFEKINVKRLNDTLLRLSQIAQQSVSICHNAQADENIEEVEYPKRNNLYDNPTSNKDITRPIKSVIKSKMGKKLEKKVEKKLKNLPNNVQEQLYQHKVDLERKNY